MGKLTDRGARGRLEAGLHGDGAGLYLAVAPSGARSWIVRATIKGRLTRGGKPYRVEIGLGSVSDVSLAEARERAANLRKTCKKGRNPLDEKRRERRTFEAVARELHSKEEATWATSHASRWLSSLEAYAFPTIGGRPIEELRRPDVVAVLEPVWRSRHETARKLKIRLAQVFDYAADRGIYPEANPARGTIKSLETFAATPRHMPALPWRDLPGLMQRLEAREGLSALCLRFLVLTCARSQEARGARWSEIDLAKGVWSLPPERMKARRAFRIPLGAEALAVVEKVRGLDSDLLFPASLRKPDGSAKMMTDMVFAALFKRMGVEGITVHGFRSTFAVWAAESAKADPDLAQAALAHQTGTTVSRAYARSDLFDRRHDLMDAWARFATGQAGQVVQLVRA